MITIKVIDKYIRPIILGSAFGLSILIFLFFKIKLDSGGSFYTSVTDAYGITSALTLYTALLISPLTFTFSKLPYRAIILRSRRAVGVVSFYFGFLHGSISFFLLLGGVDGLGFLSTRYIYAFLISFIALIILAFLAFTSLDCAQKKMGKWWIYIHRFIYLAGILIFFHIIMLGTGYADIKSLKGIVFLTLSSILILLEGLRLNNYISKKFKFKNNLSYGIIGYIIIFSVILTLVFSPTGLTQNLQVHDHDSTTSGITGSSAHGNNIEHTSPRYNVLLNQTDSIIPGKNTELDFTIRDAQNGNQVVTFQQILGQQSHLMIVDNELKYFTHIHPIFDGGKFTIDTIFPENRLYRIYFDFQPSGENEQQFAFVVKSDNFEPKIFSEIKDSDKLKIIGDDISKYSIEINDVNFKWADLLNGFQKITFNIKDANGNIVKNLQPYLNAYGHVFIVNTQDYSAIHVHADRQIAYNDPTVEAQNLSFLPINLYNETNTSGIYKLFAEFKLNDKIYLVQYIISIK